MTLYESIGLFEPLRTIETVDTDANGEYVIRQRILRCSSPSVVARAAGYVESPGGFLGPNIECKGEPQQIDFVLSLLP